MMYACYVCTRRALSSAAICGGIFQCTESMTLEQTCPGRDEFMFVKSR